MSLLRDLEDRFGPFPRPGKITTHVILAGFVLFMGFWTTTYNLEPGNVAISRDYVSGRIGLQDRHGWHVKAPWVLVSEIPTTPQRLCLTTAAHAAFNCKLVQFQPEEYRAFLEVQGFGIYWMANFISFNTGYREEYRGIRDILRGYAFSAEQYSFIRVVDEYQGQ